MAKKTQQTVKQLGLRTSVMAVASCLALSCVPLTAFSAGLGKIVVLSSLGQALRAEIEVTATREELADMKAQLASQDAFKQAGLDYATTLLGIHFSLDKRANGQSVIKLSSEKPINDPFIDMLLELNWSAGRLVREYTFLLDPPEISAKTAAPVVSVQTKPVATRKPAAAGTSSSAIDDEVRSKAVGRVSSQYSAPKAAQKAAVSSDSDQGSIEVKRGDTLHRIATANKPEGVTLEQMLVGLLRANQDAFDGGNMNRLKAGKILSVPDKSAIEAVTTSEARKIVVAQSSDWNAYRNKLAAVASQAPVADDAAKQDAAGKITAKVEDKTDLAAEPKDQLKVSKTEAAEGKVGTAGKRGEEDLIAKEKALKEANERLNALEKNLVDLQKLVELKNQNLAELQNQAASKAGPTDAAKEKPVPPAVASTAEVTVKPATTDPAAPVVEKPAEPKVAEPASAPAETKPAPKPVEAPKPPPPKPVEPPPPVEEPSFVDGLLENPLTLAGFGGILALIAAYFVSRRRAGKGEAPLDLSSTLTPQSGSLTGNSVFRSTGGQSVDTSHTPAQTDFSQAGPGSIDTDEVDPVAEADVYMAYGRDAQAEEILLEAKQKDPKRYAIHLKLLEIYANRKDLKQFETLATDLYGETGGVGADWEKAVALGLKLDPDNPLFGRSTSVTSAKFDADATLVVSSQVLKNTIAMPGELAQLSEDVSSGEEPAAVEMTAVEAPVPLTDLGSLDFDLGLEDTNPQSENALLVDEVVEVDQVPESAIESAPLDFDFAIADSSLTVAPEQKIDSTEVDFDLPDLSVPDSASTEVASLDFDLGVDSEPDAFVPDAAGRANESGVRESVPKATDADDSGVEFDVSLTESTFLGRSMPDPTSFDMSSIDLDLNEPESLKPEPVSLPVAVQELAFDLPDASFDNAQVSTAVNPDFATEQAETVVDSNFGEALEAALLPDQDFSMVQAETVVNPHISLEQDREPGAVASASQEETQLNPQFGVEQDLMPEFEISTNEEVATKLDLAKAYEEMGDFEGASELLQEVLKEGDTAQREKAQALLAKIGT